MFISIPICTVIMISAKSISKRIAILNACSSKNYQSWLAVILVQLSVSIFKSQNEYSAVIMLSDEFIFFVWYDKYLIIDRAFKINSKTHGDQLQHIIFVAEYHKDPNDQLKIKIDLLLRLLFCTVLHVHSMFVLVLGEPKHGGNRSGQ